MAKVKRVARATTVASAELPPKMTYINELFDPHRLLGGCHSCGAQDEHLVEEFTTAKTVHPECPGPLELEVV